MTVDYSRWQFFTEEDAFGKRPPLQYLIDGILPIPSLAIIYGAPGALKTNLVMHMATAVATGTPWLKSDNFKGYCTLHKPVLWIDADSGQRTLHQRWQAFFKKYDRRQFKGYLHYASFLYPRFTANNQKAIEALLKNARDFKAGLVVFDNLASLGGGEKENDALMGETMYAFRYISEQLECPVVIIHHAPKVTNGMPSPRGSSAINGAVNLALYIERNNDMVITKPTKERDDPLPGFSVVWTYTHRKDSVHELETADFVGASLLDSPNAKHEEVIIGFMEKHPQASQSELVDLLRSKKVGRGKALETIIHLQNIGRIEETGRGPNNRVLYALHEP